MSKLFSPITIKSINFKNRIVMSPMCMYSCEDGFATDWHYVHYGTRAMGGAGTVIFEASAVRADGRISTGDLGIYKDEHIEMLSRITKFVKDNGSIPAIQLAHAGRKSSTWAFGAESKNLSEAEGGWEMMAPSAIAFSDKFAVPRAMTLEDIEAIKQSFQDAAVRAHKAGFELIELHGAHGYLINEFLSPLTNKREDQYGGSRENRARFLMEIIISVQKVWPPNLPIAVRISATDWAQNGWTSDDSVWLSEQLATAGVDIIDVSSGAVVEDAKIPVGPGYQVPLATDIKSSLKDKIHVATVGMITTAVQAETILVNHNADFIVLGRELLRNPYFALQAAKELREEVNCPPQYQRAF